MMRCRSSSTSESGVSNLNGAMTEAVCSVDEPGVSARAAEDESNVVAAEAEIDCIDVRSGD